MFLFCARVGDAIATHVKSERQDHVNKRRAASIPTSWKTRVPALGVQRRIRSKLAELDEKGVEAGCAFLGVPKLVPLTSSRLHGAWLPRAVKNLMSRSGSVLVLLCAPVAETEWYCLSEQSELTMDGLFVADIADEALSITPEVLDRGARLQDRARSRKEEFSAIVLVAAFRAEVTRARRDGMRRCFDSFNDYVEPNPFEWPTRDERASQTSIWMLWRWRASGEWQYALQHQHLNNVLHQGVAVPVALEGALGDARNRRDDIGENKLESVAMQEMRAAAARALLRKDEEAAKKLILDMAADRYGDLDILTDSGKTLTMIAASLGLRSIVLLLLEKNAAANAHGSDGRAALHYAAGRASFDVMRDLLSAGADPHATSTGGRTATSDARLFLTQAKLDEIRKVMREYGWEECDCERTLMARKRLRISNDAVWRASLDVELIPMA